MKSCLKIVFTCIFVALFFIGIGHAEDSSLNSLRWRDDHLGYEASLVNSAGALSMSVSLIDLNDRKEILKTRGPISNVVPLNKTDAMVSVQLRVDKDSVIPSPHVHESNLILRLQSDGTHRLVQNCRSKSECWNAEGTITGEAASKFHHLGMQHVQRQQSLSAEDRINRDARREAHEARMRQFERSNQMLNDLTDRILGVCTDRQRRLRIDGCY